MNFIKYFSVYMLVTLLVVGAVYYDSGSRALAFSVMAFTVLSVVSLVLAAIMARIHRKNVKLALMMSISQPVLVVGFFLFFYVSNVVMPKCQSDVLNRFSNTQDINLYGHWCVSDRLDFNFIKVAEERYDEALFNALLTKGARHRQLDCARLKFAVLKADFEAIQALIDKGTGANCHSSSASPLDVLQSNTAKEKLTEDLRVQLFNQLLPDTRSITQNIKNINDPLFIPEMIKTGVDVSISDVSDAIRKGQHDLLARLVKFVEVNAGVQSLPYNFTYEQITNPLLLAVNLLDERSVQILLDAGADPNQEVSIQAQSSDPDVYSVRDIYTYALNRAKKAELKAKKPETSASSRNKFQQLASRNYDIVSMLNKTYQPHPLLLAELKVEQDAKREAWEIQKKAELAQQKIANDSANDDAISAHSNMAFQGRLYVAIEKGDLETVKRILQNKDIDINFQESESDYPSLLQHSVFHEKIDIVKYLIQQGAEYTFTSDGDSLLKIASGRGNLELVKVLTAAISSGNEELVNYLLDQGADVNPKKDHFHQPVHHAVMSKNIKLVKLLIKRGADIKAMDKGYGTLLHAAVFSGNEEMLAYVLGLGFDINILDHRQRTPLDVAHTKSMIEHMKALGAKTANEMNRSQQ